MDFVTYAMAKKYVDENVLTLGKNLTKNDGFKSGVGQWYVHYGQGELTVADGFLKFSSENHTYLSGANFRVPNIYKNENNLIYTKMLLKVTGDTRYDICVGTDVYNTGGKGVYNLSADAFRDFSEVSFVHESTNSYFAIRHFFETQDYCEILVKVLSVDLTETFGVGNEPTKEQMDALVKVIPNAFENDLVLTPSAITSLILNEKIGVGEKEGLGWKIGTLRAADGTEMSSRSRIRSDYIRVHPGMIVRCNDIDNIKFGGHIYTLDDKSWIADVGWKTTGVYIADRDCYYRIVAAYQDDRELSDEDVQRIERAITVEYRQPQRPIWLASKNRFIGHRGLMNVFPENSIIGIQMACELGLFGVEFDVWETSDGEFVIMHDATIDRTTNGTGRVDSMTLEQLRQYQIDAGGNITLYPGMVVPTFDEILRACQRYDTVLCPEIKATLDYDAFLNALKKYGLLDKTIVFDGTVNRLVEVRKRNFDVWLAWNANMSKSNIEICRRLGNAMISTTFNYVTDELIEYAKEKGVPVIAYNTVNPEEAKSWFDRGVDFITTDALV